MHATWWCGWRLEGFIGNGTRVMRALDTDNSIASVVKLVSFVLAPPRFALQIDNFNPVLGCAD
jgi:hypothetical protein